MTATKPIQAESSDATSIRLAVPTDLPQIEALLTGAGLPMDGLKVEDALIVVNGDGVDGTVALERYGTSSLLRSLAVKAEHRGDGLGTRLTRAALEVAAKSGSSNVYLLTTSAQEFFERLGFEAVPREEVANSVPSKEFDLGCCDSATAMKLPLRTRTRTRDSQILPAV